MAVLGLFFRRQFGEGFLNGRKIEEGVVSESVGATGGIEEQAFGLAAKRVQGLPSRARRSPNEAAGAVFRGNFSEFADQAGVVGLVVGVVSYEVRLVGRITGGVHAGSAAQAIDFQAGVVSENDFSRGICAVVFGFLASIGFEGETVLDSCGNGLEIGERFDRDSQRSSGSGKVTELAWVRSSDRTRIIPMRRRVRRLKTTCQV